MSNATKAVFLSYAREDTDAAKHIAEALRAFGVEVWFDQSELRGGDAWDQKIRNQIKTCALFLPLVSQRTEERAEGYFRREWKLAVDRTHDMAVGKSFIVPIVIDGTRENDAAVPEEFMRYQWTRLSNGEATPEFVMQVKRLLEAPKKSVPTTAPAGRQATGETPTARERSAQRSPLGIWIAAIIIAMIVGALWLRRPATDSAPLQQLETSPAPKPAPAVNDKSIAVLPFVNRSVDKENEFFTDGIHEDILTNLAHIAELRVVSRTSVMEYRSTTKKIRQIGQELGVAWILEGSVQRAGNKVRVTGQLINARTDEHVWAQSYDRDLTDVFAIQADLAKEIAGALSATLTPSEKSLLERRPTADPAAYDLYLKARQINRDGNDTRKELETQIALLRSATTIDPLFATAWADLVTVQAEMRFNSYDVSEKRLALAREAMETARRLDPDNPAVIAGVGTYFYYGLRDFPHALEQFNRITRQWPSDYYGHFMTGLVQRRQGKWAESLASLHRAGLLDPGSPEVARNLVVSYRALRRYDEAITEQARRVRLLPESLRESFTLAWLHFNARGSTKEADELLAGPIAGRAGSALAAGYRKLWAAAKGDLVTTAQLEREFPGEWGDLLAFGRFAPWRGAVIAVATGDIAGARALVEKVPADLRSRLVNEPENSTIWINLALIESMLGHKDEALAAAHRSLELVPESRDTLSGTGSRSGLVVALAWTGEKEAACAELSRLLAEPSNANVYELKKNPWLLPLKGDSRFEAIVNDPKNNAPLF